ncbi:MAG TPA: L-serine ammonia-lyase, iron-sulfur-dependent, subunit alpha [Lachnospiraceae bacterium]|nr:L-serine ammonia-lyase, iron-sulfur-dependent, subunit alpha [Lachnospiraceae bacterium]
MFESLEEIVRICEEEGKEFPEVVLSEDCQEEGMSEEDSRSMMQGMLDAMRQADRDYDPSLKSKSTLVGSEAPLLEKRYQDKSMLSGDFMSHCMIRALKMAESNACMKRIVAAPTAGSCGVLPSVLLSYQETKGTDDQEIVRALYVAAGVGGVIARRASISGAEGGCQAEIGAASAMAAASLAFLEGGSAKVCCEASALALKGLLGLTCDPVAGLVEVPCVKRNVLGAVNAVSCADMALSGIESRIPPDEVIDAMKSIGHAMSPSLRETGNGGLAMTPTGQKIREDLTPQDIL